MTAPLSSAAPGISTRKRPDSPRRTLQSILPCQQPEVEFEVVAVDNAGDPATREVCEWAT